MREPGDNDYFMKQKLLLLLMALTALQPLRVVARDFTYTYEGQTITYTVIDEDAKTCSTKPGTGSTAGNYVTGDLILPSNPIDGEDTYTLISIAQYSFLSNKDLTSIVIPETVTTIKTLAFDGATNLKYLNTGNGVSTIMAQAFSNCISLISVTLGKSVSIIEYGAFAFCPLESITFPASCKEIQEYAFYGCDDLVVVNIESEEPPMVGEDSFPYYGLLNVPENSVQKYKASKVWSKFNIPSGIKYAGDLRGLKVIGFDSSIGPDVNIPNRMLVGRWIIAVGEIADSAFYNCKTITSVSMPSWCKIGSYAFAGCDNLATLRKSGDPTEVGENAFTKFEGVDLFVEPDVIKEYQETEPWNKFNIEAMAPALRYEIEHDSSLGKDVAKVVGVGEGISAYCVIPGEVEIEGNNYPVVAIADRAFSNCREIFEIEFPDNPISIGEYAFLSCKNLQFIQYQNNNSIMSIGNAAFAWCESLRHFYIPSSIEQIGQDILWGCSGLETISLGSSVKENIILAVNRDTPSLKKYEMNVESQNYAVQDGVLFNKSLSKLIAYPQGLGGDYIIPSTVDTIGERAFLSSTITSITIPSSVVAIGNAAFQNSNYFTSLVIPESVKEIGEGGFYGCEALESVTIKGNLPVLGTGAFAACDKLKTFIIEDDNYVVKDGVLFNKDLTTLVALLGSIEGAYKVPDTVTEIAGGAFEGSGITAIDIPSSVTKIGDRAFCGCENLTTIKIPNSVVSLGESAFLACVNLQSVELSNSLISIGKYAFQVCPKLTSISIPNSVTLIGSSSFNGCNELSTVTLGNSIATIEGGVFFGCEKIEKVYAPSLESWMGITFADETANPLYYGAELIIDNKSTDVVEIPEETEEVGDYAFAGLKDLVKVVIADAVEKIGDGSFAGTGLENISIPQNVKEIGEKAFQNCKSLLSAVIGKISGKLTRAAETDKSELSTVGMEAFAGCENLDKVSIGSNIGSIGEKAFEGCGSITRVDCYSLLAPEAVDDAFDALAFSQAELHVPVGYADVFESAPVWSLFSKIIADLDAPETLTLDAETLKLGIGEKKQITATSSAEGTLTWESSDSDVATVSAEGLVTAVQEGTARITVTASSGARAYCDVTVVKIEASKIELNAPEAELIEGESVQLTATITPAETTDQTVIWTSSDVTVATVDAFGSVSALKPGTATITAKTANGKEASCKVTVLAKIIEAEGIELNVPEAEVIEGESLQLTATVTPADATDQSLTWSSSDVAVATVDQDGLVTALKAGTATITVRTANGKEATCELTVEAKTGIDGVEADAQISVAVRDGVIIVTAPDDADVEVYSMTGLQMAKTRGHRIEGLAGGIYIVRVGGKSFKVIVK